MSLNLKIKLFLTFIFTVVTINLYFTFLLDRYADDKLHWVNHTNDVLLEAEQFVHSVKNSKIGLMGFLLTKDPNYLEPYHRSRTEVTQHFIRLKEITAKRENLQTQLAFIEKYMKLKLTYLDESIQLADQNNSINLIKTNKGKEYMDKINLHLHEFIALEKLLLEERKGDYRANRAKVTTLMVVEMIIFVFLALFTIIFFDKNLFRPLKILLESTQKMKKGMRLSVEDVVSNDEMGYLISNFFDMYEEVQKNTQELNHKAHHDELTGLYNRISVYPQITQATTNAQEYNLKSAVLFMDLNKFKVINDTLGHGVGDKVLQESAKRLQQSIRSDDMVFRIGGDEFLVLIKSISNQNDVESIISHILKTFEEPFAYQNHVIDIRLSIGVAIFPDDSKKTNELIKFADIAMYHAKKTTNQNYSFFARDML